MPYKYIRNGAQTGLGILRVDEVEHTVTTIPPDPANTDWQRYQTWLAIVDENGDPLNQPLPAD